MSERDQRIFKLLLDIDFAAQKNEVKLKRVGHNLELFSADVFVETFLVRI